MNKKAFTLIELIIVIVLLGIIGIYVTPLITTSGFQDNADVNVLLTNLRYTQHESMVEGGKWEIKFDIINNQYTILNSSGNIVTLPGSKNPVKVKSGLNKVVDEDGNSISNIYFDYLGRPVDSQLKLFRKKILITISKYQIIIEPYSGGIYVKQ